jgi:hypothetical protein
MVELILSEAKLARLKAAVTIDSEESAALGRAVRFGNKVLSPESFAVKCTRAIANRLLSVAKRSCPEWCRRFALPSNKAARPKQRKSPSTVATAADCFPLQRTFFRNFR